MKTLALILIFCFFVFGCTLFPPTGPPVEEDYHVHADFKVFLGGNFVDFNKAEYMSTPFKELNPNAHLHDFEYQVIHFHDKAPTLGDFFASLGMRFSTECFFDGNKEFCSGGQKTIWLFVNGKPNDHFEDYRPKDLDKILIYFGPNTPSKEILDSVTNRSCIYSEKCPAPPGFEIPIESCSISKPCQLPGT